MQTHNPQFEQGQTVFDSEGHEFTYATAVPGHGHVVSARFETYDGAGDEVSHDGPDIIHHGPLFADPPTGRRAQQIAILDEQLAQRRQELAQLNDQIRAAKIDQGSLLERLKQHQALQRIDDVLAGRITHVVSVEHGTIAVRSADDLSDTSWNGKARLLSLFGNAKGDLEYQLNRYADGSGDKYEAWPCFSQEEATAKAVELIEEQMDKCTQGGKAPSARLLQSYVGHLQKFGAPVPEAAREALHKTLVAEAEAKVADARAALDRADSALSTIRKAGQ
ncbi:hypothetical protein BJP27_24260 (plasmid) [Pseudomonas oryzihabitans]|nr:hypothetical protein BJP27_24260 [Pseudomonas psychrotolerans]